MVDTREDGIYIRLAGKESQGEAFTLEFVKAYSFYERTRKNERSNTCRFAEHELEILSKSATDPKNRPIIEPFKDEILSLCDKFGKSGQSGGSAPMTATAISHAVKTLMLQEPICPITGIDEEWINVRDVSDDDEMMYQNKRCSALFKSKNGKCWYIDAIVKKVVQTGHCFSGSFWLSKEDYLAGGKSKKIGCAHYIKSFPFVPKTFYIDVIEEEVAKDDWEMYLKNPKQLERVFRYYDKRSL